MAYTTGILMLVVFIVYIVLETRLGSAGRRSIDFKGGGTVGAIFRLHINRRFSYARHNNIITSLEVTK